MKATEDWINSANRRFIPRAKTPAFVHLGQYTAELYETGAGDPLVLVPGLAGGFELLGPLARTFAGHHHVFSYQLRGESDCFILRHPFDLDGLVEDFAELVEKLNLERPIIMGLSFGGIIALKYAMRYPNRLDRLIVQGVGARYERGLIQQIASTVLSRFPLPADSPFVNQFFNLLFGGRQKRDELFEFVTNQIWQTDQSVMSHRFRLVEDLNLENQLHRIKAPTLVLTGDRDVLVSDHSLQPLHDEIPDVRLARLPDCGHLAFVTRPELIAQHVEEFLRS